MDSLEEDFLDLAGPAGPVPHPGRVVLHSVARFPLMIIVLTVLGGTLGLAIALSKPNTYMSVGMLLVRMGAREAQTPEGALNSDFEVRTGRGGASTDEMMMLMDPALRGRVAERVGVQRLLQKYNPRARDSQDTAIYIQWMHNLQAWLMGYEEMLLVDDPGPNTASMIKAATIIVGRGTEISNAVRTNTIVVAFTGHDPALAQSVASAYIEVMQERHREFYDPEVTLSLVTLKLDEAVRREEQAEATFLARREQDGILDLAGRIDTLTERVGDLEVKDNEEASRLEVLKIQIPATDKLIREERLRTAPGSLLLDPPSPENAGDETADEDPPILDTPENLLKRRRDIVQELAGLKRTLNQTSALYKNKATPLEQDLSSIDKALSILRERAANGDGPYPGSLQSQLSSAEGPLNPVYQDLLRDRNNFSREQESLIASRKRRVELLQAKRQELDRLVALGPAYDSLESDLTESTRKVQELRTQLSKANTLALTSTEKNGGSLQVSQQPFLPTEKVGPNRLKTLLMGLFGGLALGLSVALARQVMDSRLRYPADATQALGLRVLGVVPEQREWRRAGKLLKRTIKR